VTVFTYVIEHDLGFAPNPFHGACTLACCKPVIRKTAKIGDIILGLGAAKPKLSGHLCYWMRIDEVLTFDQYWSDPRFRRKKPKMSGTTFLRYGDNIYHHDNNGDYRQEYSFHSLENGEVSLGDLHRDTGRTDRVLISREFAYWGLRGIKMPEELECFTIRGPGHWCDFEPEEVAALIAWLGQHPERGYRGEPAHWQFIGIPKRQRKQKLGVPL
jgi:hypothetical protein